MNRKLTLFMAAIMLFTNMFLTDVSVAKAADLNDAPVAPVEEPVKAPKDSEVAPIKNVESNLYSSDIVTVSWAESSKVDGYVVYEKESDKYKKIKTIKNEETTQYKVKDVSKGKTHTYAVRGYVKENKEYNYSSYKSDKVYVPKVLTKRTKGYSKTTSAKLIRLAKKKLGSPYVWGSNGPNAFDCSGFVHYVSNNTSATTKRFIRTSAAGTWNMLKEYSIGTKKLSKAQPGDIVFLSSTKNGRISHAAFYYGDGKYIHATTPGRGVEITGTKYYGYVRGIVRLPNL